MALWLAMRLREVFINPSSDGRKPTVCIIDNWHRLKDRPSYCRRQWRIGRSTCIRLLLPLAVTSDISFSHRIGFYLRFFLFGKQPREVPWRFSHYSPANE